MNTDGLLSLRNMISKIGVECDSGWNPNNSGTLLLRSVGFRQTLSEAGVELVVDWLSEELMDPEGTNVPSVWVLKNLDDRTLLLATYKY